jgi:hypothetical protein
MLIRWLRDSLRELPGQIDAPFNSCTQTGCVFLLVFVLIAVLFPLLHAALTWLRGH